MLSGNVNVEPSKVHNRESTEQIKPSVVRKGQDLSQLNSSELGDLLCDSNVPIAQRMRTCFQLKALNSDDVFQQLDRGIWASDSDLLKHEICYVMGQMQDRGALSYLKSYLSNRDLTPIVRHESGEAIAAIGDVTTIPFLECYVNDPQEEVAETCQLAVKQLKEHQKKQNIVRMSSAGSVDPAPPFPPGSKGIEELEKTLMDESEEIWIRYRALFTLRDLSTDVAVKSICKGFTTKSALLRHEIAFVLGQMMNRTALPALNKVLLDPDEHGMVRHEAAEAIGSIAEDESLVLLKKLRTDKERVVAESCDVALDMHGFWTHPECE